MTDKTALLQELAALNIEGWRLTGVEREADEADDSWIDLVELSIHGKLIRRHADLKARIADTRKLVPPSNRG